MTSVGLSTSEGRVQPLQKMDLPAAVQKKLRNEKIRYIALSILTLGVYALGVFVIDKLQVKWINRAFMPSAGKKSLAQRGSENFKIPTYDGINLDAKEFLCEKPTNKWIIFFCPNAALYEDFIRMFSKDALRANVLFFNYRGCGHSEGVLKGGATKLLLDGVAVMNHLKKKGVENKDILLYGFSIGGAVAATVAEHYEGVKYFGDRAPARISAVVRSIASCIAGAITKLTRFEINAFKSWKKIPDANKAVSYHHQDGVVKYRTGLYYLEKQRIKKAHPEWREAKIGKAAYGLAQAHKPAHVKMSDSGRVDGQIAHCRPYSPEEALAAFLPIIKRLLT